MEARTCRRTLRRVKRKTNKQLFYSQGTCNIWGGGKRERKNNSKRTKGTEGCLDSGVVMSLRMRGISKIRRSRGCFISTNDLNAIQRASVAWVVLMFINERTTLQTSRSPNVFNISDRIVLN